MTQTVKNDIVIAQQLCRSEVGKHPHVRKHLQLWSLRLFYIVAENIQSSYLLASFSRWKLIAKNERHQELNRLYELYLALRIVRIQMRKMIKKTLAFGWIRWQKYVDCLQIKDKVVIANKMATRIQKCVRSRIARLILCELRHERNSNTAIKIQSCARTKLAKIQKETRIIFKACCRLQRALRIHNAKTILRYLKFDQAQYTAAVSLQRVLRGRNGRKSARMARIELLNEDSANIIQRIVRGRSGKKRAGEQRLFLKKTNLTIFIQKNIRILISKRRLQVLIKEKKEREKLKDQSCLFIQRVYRGCRERVVFKLRMKEYMSILEEKKQAATIIQCFYRKIIASRIVKSMTRDITEKMIASARKWTEIWNYETNTWYYYNEEKDESLWEPPDSGYTKSSTN